MDQRSKHEYLRKVLRLALVLIVALTMAACGQTSPPTGDDDDDDEGALVRGRGRPEVARARLEERLRIQSSLGDEAGMAETHGGLGHLWLEAGDLIAAEESFEATLDIARRLNLILAEVSALEGMALVAHERGLHKRSKELFVQSSSIRTEHELAPTLNAKRLSEIHPPTSTATQARST